MQNVFQEWDFMHFERFLPFSAADFFKNGIFIHIKLMNMHAWREKARKAIPTEDFFVKNVKSREKALIFSIRGI